MGFIHFKTCMGNIRGGLRHSTWYTSQGFRYSEGRETAKRVRITTSRVRANGWMKQCSWCFRIICILSLEKKNPLNRKTWRVRKFSFKEPLERLLSLRREGDCFQQPQRRTGSHHFDNKKLKELKQSYVSWKKKKEGAKRFPLVCAELSPPPLPSPPPPSPFQQPEKSRVVISRRALVKLLGGLIPLWHPGAEGRRDQRVWNGSKMTEWLCFKFPEVCFCSVRILLQRLVTSKKKKKKWGRKMWHGALRALKESVPRRKWNGSRSLKWSVNNTKLTWGTYCCFSVNVKSRQG